MPHVLLSTEKSMLYIDVFFVLMQLKAIERSINKLVTECIPQAPAYDAEALAARIQAMKRAQAQLTLSA